MDKLDTLVVNYLEIRLLIPERLEGILESVLERRESRAAQSQTHAAELTRRASEAGQRCARLYEAIETGIADLDAPSLKNRVTHLKELRDQARSEAIRAEARKNNDHPPP